VFSLIVVAVGKDYFQLIAAESSWLPGIARREEARYG
jgi:hypothetical protein